MVDQPDEVREPPKGFERCDECEETVPEEQILVKPTRGDKPDIHLCPMCE